MNLFEKYQNQFPALKIKMNDKPLVYLDTAATSLKPQRVIDSIVNYYTNLSCNVHRSIHTLGEEATIEYEGTRDVLKSFVNAHKREEIIFTKGTTEGLNLLARTLGEGLQEGDQVLITELEHHSNIVPWQLACQRSGATLKYIPLNNSLELDLDSLDTLLSERTKIVSFSGLSNTLGTTSNIESIIQKVREKTQAKVIVDAAQLVLHRRLDVQKLDCDFLVFSAHKVFGPTGVGVLYGKEKLLNSLPPFHGGGDMIDKVSFEETTYNDLPYKFEAGTPAIASVVAFKEAIKFLEDVGIEQLHSYTHELNSYLKENLLSIPGIKIFESKNQKSSITSFTIEGVHNQDLASLISMDGVAIRTGHHCTQPLLRKLNVSSTARISLSLYNSKSDIDVCISSLKKAQEILR